MKKVIIIGAGPAGLTAGYDLLSKSSDYEVTIVEESSVVGGLCARLESEENVLDAGGHMFISKNPAVKNFWTSILPAQGVPSKDDKLIDRYCKIHNGGPDPDVEEDVILSREKLTRIYKDNKFYESPIKFNKIVSANSFIRCLSRNISKKSGAGNLRELMPISGPFPKRASLHPSSVRIKTKIMKNYPLLMLQDIIILSTEHIRCGKQLPTDLSKWAAAFIKTVRLQVLPL